jgi:chemotaxis protein CheC
MNGTEIFSEEDKDFINEMMNIGAGNAATALSQLLQCPVDMKIPAVHIASPSLASILIGKPELVVSCVKMSMVGDIIGDLFFLVPDEYKAILIQKAKVSMPGSIEKSPELDSSVLKELGNITAGVYLTSIHDFCDLNIYHTVPLLAEDMLMSLLDETIATKTRAIKTLLLVENEFVLLEKKIQGYFLLIPNAKSLKVIADSIKEAKKKYEGK